MTLTEIKLENVENEINYCLAKINNLEFRLGELEAERLKLRAETSMEETGRYEVER